MKTLKIEHLAGYLGTGLKVKTVDGIFEFIGWEPNYGIMLNTTLYGVGAVPEEYQIVVHPLSDLTEKELRENGFWHHIDFLTVEKGMPIHAPYEMVVYLFSKHYDVFGLIEQNLAIDINTLNPKP